MCRKHRAILPARSRVAAIALPLREKLTKQDPTNAGWQRDLSNSYESIGDVQSAQEDLAGALNSYRDSLTMREKLAKQDSTNTDWQRDLSLSYERIGNLQKAQGDFAGALKSYRDSLAIREKLTKQDSTNADWRRDLSLSYESLGDVQSAQGDLASALKSYRDSLAIREKLAKQDPTSVGRQVDVAFSCWRTGTTLARSDSRSGKEARSMVEKARDKLRQLKEQTSLTAQQQGWLDSIETDLQKMQENK
jgi:tetratricopeptide (TPR) repeat protein